MITTGDRHFVRSAASKIVLGGVLLALLVCVSMFAQNP